MKARITRINRTLFELEVGIFLFGLVCQAFALFVKDKAAVSLGLWIGLFVAGLGAFHMWWSLDHALELAERSATKQMTLHNIFRYLVYVVVIAAAAISGVANPIAVFVGLMGLKASAYLHFLTRKLSAAVYGKESAPSQTEEAFKEESAKM